MLHLQIMEHSLEENCAVVFNHFIGGWKVHATDPKALRCDCPGECPTSMYAGDTHDQGVFRSIRRETSV